MHILRYTIILFFICCIGCNNDSYQYAKKIVLKDSFIIPRDIELDNINYIVNQSDEHFDIYFPSKDKLLRYNLHNKSFDDSIILPTPTVDKFYFSIKDSFVYILPFGESKIIEFSRFDSLRAKIYSSTSPISLYCLFFMFDMSNNKNVFLTYIPSMQIAEKKGREDFFSTKMIRKYKLINEGQEIKEEYAVGQFPKQYTFDFITEPAPIPAKINDSVIAYIFSASKYIFIAKNDNVDSNEMIGMSPSYIQKFNPDSISNMSYSKGYQLNQDFFVKLLYDKENNYLFVFRVRQPMKIEDGLLPLWEDKELVVYAIDAANNTVVAEKSLGRCGEYELGATFCYNGLLHLAKLKNNRLHFEKYGLNK